MKYIISCRNMDGGFGCTPGGESHAGQSTLFIIHHLYLNITFSMLLNAWSRGHLFHPKICCLLLSHMKGMLSVVRAYFEYAVQSYGHKNLCSSPMHHTKRGLELIFSLKKLFFWFKSWD